MDDTWHTFPTSMGDDQAWITYNHTFATGANTDNRNQLLGIQTDIQHPTVGGMPTNEEFAALNLLDDRLVEGINQLGGIYVGRITVAGKRYFYYYLDSPKDSVNKLIDKIADNTNYPIRYFYEEDPPKNNYWKDLYPSEDDWQVVKDLEVLDLLSKNGDIADKTREVSHWAYFPTAEAAQSFVDWLRANQYAIKEQTKTDDKFVVHYTHRGTMQLHDITHHSIVSARKTRELGGDYDGWETSVEKD